jgi:hypothetical protein
MNSQNSQESEIQRRERELQERETQLRMRELQIEVYQNPTERIPPSQQSESSSKLLSRKIVNVAKFLGIVVAVVVAIKVAQVIAGLLIVAVVAWVGYQIFFKSDR